MRILKIHARRVLPACCLSFVAAGFLAVACVDAQGNNPNKPTIIEQPASGNGTLRGTVSFVGAACGRGRRTRPFRHAMGRIRGINWLCSTRPANPLSGRLVPMITATTRSSCLAVRTSFIGRADLVNERLFACPS
jgi:hypothetical protein